ncbi:MAG: 2OG-Fe(II) oxygenase [Polyangiales bacterium]
MSVSLLPDPDRPLDHRNPLIVSVDGVLSLDECAALIARIEALGPTAAPITTDRGFVMRPDIRNNTRVMFDDVELASTVLSRVRARLPERLERDWHICGVNERLRCYRYEPGQYFAPHFDGAFVRSRDERSLLTLMVYLNACEGGGHTGFLDQDLRVAPRAGAALIFNHHLLHEGAEVTAGVKYAVRSDVMYRRAEG